MTDDIEWGPDPDLYAKMAEPYPTQEEAEAALERFLEGVAKLRAECRIPEVVMVALTWAGALERPRSASRALAMGNPGYHAELAATAFHQYATPVIERAERLQAMAMAKAAEDR